MTSFERAEVLTKQGIFVTIRNIFFFFHLPEKFWTNLSEITAPLPLNIPNLLILKYKFKGQMQGQRGGRRGQKRGRKQAGRFICPQTFSNLFKGLVIRGQRGSSKDWYQTRFSMSSLFLYLKENRLFLVIQKIVIKVNRVNDINSLNLLCAGSVLVHRFQVAWNGAKKAKSLTAHSQIICGYAYSRSNKINKLGGLDQQKYAVRFKSSQIREGQQTGQGHPPYRKFSGLSGLPSPIHSFKMAGYSKGFSKGIVKGFFFSFVFSFRKVGGPGGGSLC